LNFLRRIFIHVSAPPKAEQQMGPVVRLALFSERDAEVLNIRAWRCPQGSGYRRAQDVVLLPLEIRERAFCLGGERILKTGD
jgi:hypothetical protein